LRLAALDAVLQYPQLGKRRAQLTGRERLGRYRCGCFGDAGCLTSCPCCTDRGVTYRLFWLWLDRCLRCASAVSSTRIADTLLRPLCASQGVSGLVTASTILLNGVLPLLPFLL
jgi:hypothetical protein